MMLKAIKFLKLSVTSFILITLPSCIQAASKGALRAEDVSEVKPGVFPVTVVDKSNKVMDIVLIVVVFLIISFIIWKKGGCCCSSKNNK